MSRRGERFDPAGRLLSDLGWWAVRVTNSQRGAKFREKPVGDAIPVTIGDFPYLEASSSMHVPLYGHGQGR